MYVNHCEMLFISSLKCFQTFSKLKNFPVLIFELTRQNTYVYDPGLHVDILARLVRGSL